MKIRIGDIFEINTPKGKAYLHYIHKDKELGDLIRVLKGLFIERPTNLEEIANQDHRYMIFFPLTYAFKKKIVEHVDYFSASRFGKPKYMRTSHYIGRKFIGWHIVNTSTWKWQLVEQLTEEQKLLSPWGIWNDTLLIERLTEDWTLDKWS